VFIYPSLFEGVGLPVLEAMRSGVPVVTSNTTSLREIVRDAAITLDPLDVEALGQAVWTLVSDDRLREDYIQKGCSRSEEFSWKTTAQRTLETYKRMLR
jgi:glycosyltransferase involved in cell wall biosynthesis